MIKKTDEQWRRELTPEQYRVLREQGTEPPFTGAYWNSRDPGTYQCAGCGAPLFSSETKYDSGSGWPSFFRPLQEAAIATKEDASHGMRRTEVLCDNCGGHLGHLFPDGPKPTGLRYCINSASLKKVPKP
jgi:peptide-methionine (R)-S-oxide reductase